MKDYIQYSWLRLGRCGLQAEFECLMSPSKRCAHAKWNYEAGDRASLRLMSLQSSSVPQKHFQDL